MSLNLTRAAAPRVEMKDVTLALVERLVGNMRDSDRTEIMAVRWTDRDQDLVNDVMMMAGALWKIWTYDNEPVALMGITPIRPGVAVANAFGSNAWKHAVRPMMRWVREYMRPLLVMNGYHRVEAAIHMDNRAAQAWARQLDGKQEAILWEFGKNREDFVLYVWRA